jgi:uncharacterized membrane protein
MNTRGAWPLVVMALISCDGTRDTGVAAALATPAAVARASRVQCYSLQELGPVWSDWIDSASLGVNSAGVVVGTTARWSSDPDPRRAFLFKQGSLAPLGDLGAGLSEARAVNEWGVAVGGSRDAAGNWRAASFFHGRVADLGTLDGTNSWAVDVNNLGFAVGNGYVSGVAHAAGFFMGKAFDLGDIGGNTYANGVNDLFEVVGTGQLADGTWSGFVLRQGKMKLLGDLGIPAPSSALKINVAGTVCGSSYDPNAYLRQAFLLHRDGSRVLLQDLGYPYTACVDVNDAGTAVGLSDDGTAWRAVIWETPADPPIDLNARLVPPRSDFVLIVASGIGASGRITAYGWSDVSSQTEGYLLTPTSCPR